MTSGYTLVDWMEEIPRNVPSDKGASLYRDEKSRTHTTKSGKGRIGQLLNKKKGKKDGKRD